MRLTSAHRLLGLGVFLLSALTICSHYFIDRGGFFFMVSLTLAGAAYLLALREFFTVPKLSRRLVLLGLFFAFVWHLEFLRLPTGPDDDIHRYVWDGRLQRFGYNPYLVIPSDPAVRALHTPETRNLNNPDLPSPYPPGAQIFFRLVTAVQESTFALKVAFVLCDWAIVLVLLDILRRSRLPSHLVLAYAWNPLLAIEVAGSGHIDILGALLLVVSLAALFRRWRATAAVAFALAVAVKFLPIVLLPLYWRRIRIRDLALGSALVALLYFPFLDHRHLSAGSLGTYLQAFRFNGPVFAALQQLVPWQWLTAFALLIGLATAAWLRMTMALSPSLFAWPMAASLLCAPAVFPWYLLWLLPFLTSSSMLLIATWTISIISTYMMWHLRSVTGVWGSLPVWVMLLEYGCVAIVAATICFRKMREKSKLPVPFEGEQEPSQDGAPI